MIRKDILTEYEYGKGAIRAAGKFLIQEASGKRTLVAGVVVGSLANKETEDCEMWEGEIILIPRRKYAENKTEDYRVLGIDQKLRGMWSQAKYWRKKIFDKDI